MGVPPTCLPYYVGLHEPLPRPPTPQGQRTLLQIGNKKTSFIVNIKLRHVLPRPVRGDSPCGGCWGCSPQRYLLDVASSRTLTVRPQQGLRRLAQRRAFRSTAFVALPIALSEPQALLVNVRLYIRRKFMEYVIAVYRSRSVSMRAYNFLLSRGVMCSLISTPRSANVGCGLSVKMRVDAYRAYGAALSDAETFVGFFLIKQTMNGQTIVRL